MNGNKIMQAKALINKVKSVYVEIGELRKYNTGKMKMTNMREEDSEKVDVHNVTTTTGIRSEKHLSYFIKYLINL